MALYQTYDSLVPDSPETKQKLTSMFFEINTLLGGSNIELPLEEEDYMVGFSRALSTYRLHSSRSVDFVAIFLTMKNGQRFYTLPEEIDNVRRIRSSRSGIYGGGIPTTDSLQSGLGDTSVLDSALLSGLLGTNASGPTMSLVDYENYSEYIETLAKMFGNSAIQFYFKHGKENQLEILDRIRVDQIVLLEASKLRSVESLLDDHFSRDILLRLVKCEVMSILSNSILLGILPGPAGGATINWSSWLAIASEEKKELVNNMLRLEDSSDGYAPMIFG